jgi:hypothetical protein
LLVEDQTENTDPLTLNIETSQGGLSAPRSSHFILRQETGYSFSTRLGEVTRRYEWPPAMFDSKPSNPVNCYTSYGASEA